MLIDGKNLDLNSIIRVSKFFEGVELSPETFESIDKSSEFINKIVEEGKVVYGINTGFGKLCDKVIPPQSVSELQENLLLSHAAGTGEPLTETEVRATILVRANSLAKGFSGIRRAVIEKLLELLNKQIYPYVPSYGSLGASGDLAPLAHISLLLIGKGKIIDKGTIKDALPFLQEKGIEPIDHLHAKEGLALINGTSVEAGISSILISEARYLLKVAVKSSALSMESLAAKRDPFDYKIQEVRNIPEQKIIADMILEEINGSRLINSTQKVQDAYTIRCIPQVYGAVLMNLSYIEKVLTGEINAVTDNPIVFAESGEILSGGNFHAEAAAFAMDLFSIILADLSNIIERRINRLLNPALSGLPPFLADKFGLHSGLMILQYTVASLVSENKMLAQPASVDSIPVSADQEDHVSMGMNSVLKARKVIQNLRKIIGAELIIASQAVDFKGKEFLGKGTLKTYTKIREKVPFISSDRILSYDLDKIEDLIIKEEI
jgi:histidine ammonia-lyase